MSRFFRPPIGDPFWDSFWTSERSFFDTHFGSTLTEEDFIPANYFIRRRPLGAPRSPLMGPHSPLQATQMHPLDKAYTQQAGQPTTGQQQQSGGELMTQMQNPSNDKYQIMVDVSHFNPEEISVKMIDNAIVVTGKHEDKADNYGYVSRQFSRKYLLPVDVEPETVTSTLSADGILTIQAPRKMLHIDTSVSGRSVPIAISNQALSPALNLVPPQFPTTVGSGQHTTSMGSANISIEKTSSSSTTTTSSQGPMMSNVEQQTTIQTQQVPVPVPPPPQPPSANV